MGHERQAEVLCGPRARFGRRRCGRTPEVVAAKQLDLNPVLFAATNSSGGVMGKMISPQNIATGVSVTDLRKHEGIVFARTFWYSVILTLMLGVLVALQQYVFPGIIPR
jgi:lactate permease